MSNLAFGPMGVPRSAYAEAQKPFESWLEQACAEAVAPALRLFHSRRLRCQRFVETVNAASGTLQDVDPPRLRACADELRHRLRSRKWPTQLVARTFAVVRQVAAHALGMRHFDVQVIGGWILFNGMVAEMDTGEGKTLTATLPAATVALAGLPVHIVTVNDYLAERDASLMRPLYEALGLNVGVITSGMSTEARRRAYGCNITYCTNKELVFDYLRDRIALDRTCSQMRLQIARLALPRSHRPELLLRGLHYAIVDEADSVLIDEARTPLIISKSSEIGEAASYQAALTVAVELQSGVDFTIDGRDRVIRFTDSGRASLVDIWQSSSLSIPSRWRREELVRQALIALHLMQRDTHYLIKDGKVQIIDEYTGRVTPDRSWEDGLQQLIELKENCTITRQNEPVSRISYQHFFRRYRRLAGMTGTAREVRGELFSVYNLPVVRVPTHNPPHRVNLGERVYPTAEAKWQALVSRVSELRRRQRPILIGTRSVAASEHLSELLRDAGIAHQVLNARQDEAEAAIIAQAGGLNKITVATNMAGRGTDIRLAPGVAELGGLHVIGTERHDSQRIDRQLWGRCGRQGDPGSYEMILSLEDEIFVTYGTTIKGLLESMLRRSRRIGPWLGGLALYWSQFAAERTHRQKRRELLNVDQSLQAALAFSGDKF
jgi:preprotein translocase subunit SecA